MEIHLNQQPASAPAPFGMPACGRTLGRCHGTTTGSTLGNPAGGFAGGFAGAGTDPVVRDRGAMTWGETGLAVSAYIPGSTAWSPPIQPVDH